MVCICLGCTSLEFLDKYDLEYAKVASAMIVDTFLEELLKEKIYFISTGMSTLEDIES